MGRGKVRLEMIDSPSDRRATLRKRGNGLRKKARELATLCGIDVCVVVYGGEGEPPEVWPEDPEQAARVLERFRSMPEIDQCRKMQDGASLLRERVVKLQQQVRKAEREGRERETKLLLHEAMAGRRAGFAGLTVQQLVSLGWMAEDRANKVRERIAQLRGQGQQQAGVYQPPPPPPPPLPYPPTYATTSADDVSSPQPQLPQQGWLMEVIRAGWDVGSESSYCNLSNGSGSYDGDMGAEGGRHDHDAIRQHGFPLNCGFDRACLEHENFP